jgi:ribosomal protein S20
MTLAHHRRRIIALGLAGILAIGAVGVTFAENPAGGGSGTATASQIERHPIRNAAAVLRDVTGLPVGTFAKGAKDGQSINQTLTANGKDPAAVQTAALAEIKSDLDTAVANGKITQAQADAAYAKAQEKLPEFMSRVPDPAKHPRLHAIIGAVKGELETVAKSIGIPVKDLASALKGGQTIAQVATEHGKDPNQVIADMTTAANTRIDEAVTDGKLTPDQAAKLKTRASTAIARLVNEGRQKHAHGTTAPNAPATPAPATN